MASLAFLQHGSLSVVELFTWDWLPREKVEASRHLKARLRTSTVSLLLHFIGQSQSQGQPKLKSKGTRLYLELRGMAHAQRERRSCRSQL